MALAEAWYPGVSTWTTSRRQSFANDLTSPQLIAVTTAEVNTFKGDKDPAEWVPPLASKRCAYSKMWIHTKYALGAERRLGGGGRAAAACWTAARTSGPVRRRGMC